MNHRSTNKVTCRGENQFSNAKKKDYSFFLLVSCGVIFFVMLSAIYLYAILPSVISGGWTPITLKLDEKFLSNANNIGGALNVITGVLSGVALILGLYAVRIQGEGLEVQRQALSNTTKQTHQQAQEILNSKLFISLEHYEKRLRRVNEKLESKFPSGEMIDIFAGALAPQLEEERLNLENKKRFYSINIEYLSAKIEDQLNESGDRYTSEEHNEYVKFKEWQKIKS